MPAANNDLAKLQGSWNIKILEVNGAPMPAGTAQIIVQGESFTTTAMGAPYDGAIIIDPMAKPKSLDLIFATGPEKGNRSLGIYKLDGDTWTICLTLTGTKRPSKFATTPKSGLALETLERHQQETPPPPATNDADFPPTPELEGEWQMTACTLSGKPLPPEHLQYGRRIAKGNETTVTMNGAVLLAARYRLNAANIDYVLTQGPHKGKPQYGIWKLEDGVFTTCFATPGADRPTTFTSTKGDGGTLTSWRRV